MSRLIRIFDKITLPDLSRVYRISNILPDLSCIFLFSINVINLSGWSTSNIDIELRDSLSFHGYIFKAIFIKNKSTMII